MMVSMGIVLSISRESSLPMKQERTKSVIIREPTPFELRREARRGL